MHQDQAQGGSRGEGLLAGSEGFSKRANQSVHDCIAPPIKKSPARTDHLSSVTGLSNVDQP